MACFDPLRLSEKVEAEVYNEADGRHLRRYWRFRSSRHYGGNNAGDVVGCNLRCAFCWAWKYAFSTRGGEMLSPRDAAKRIARAGPFKTARLTGGEPTIGWEHTRRLAALLVARGYTFILETNGILIGAGLVDPVRIPGGVRVRVSIKAPTPAYFERATGACARGFEFQIKALEALHDAGLRPGIDYWASVVMGVAPRQAYESLLERLARIDPMLASTVEEEYIVLYPHVVELMRRRGFTPRIALTPEGELIDPRKLLGGVGKGEEAYHEDHHVHDKL
ncbi:MAG: radical SAM protein [Desulfurococcales archaeon]|nr:radical SAM protein [Desulfurococcales archaeon]